MTAAGDQREAWFIINLLLAASGAAWAWLWTTRNAVPYALAALGIMTGACLIFFFFLLRRKGVWKAPVLFALAWFLLSCFIANRILAGRRHIWEGGYRLDKEVGWYPRRNMRDFKLTAAEGRTYRVSTDELGHRNPLPYPEDHVLPVLVQGDSNIFGYGLAEEETLCAQLNALSGTARFYNAGVPGFDLNHFYFQYRKLAGKFTIRTRLVVFNIDNDFTLSALKTAYFLPRPYLEVRAGEVIENAGYANPLPAQGFDNRFVDAYAQYDPLIHHPGRSWALDYPSCLVRTPLGARIVGKLHWKFCYLFGVGPAHELARSIYTPLWLMEDAPWPAPYHLFKKDFPLLLKAVYDQNPGIVICLLPMQQQLYRAKKGDTEGAFAFNRYFARHCSELGIRLIDPCPRLAEAADTAGLFQSGDEHLSARGMRILAKEILKGMKP